jgi:hypothetical protein
MTMSQDCHRITFLPFLLLFVLSSQSCQQHQPGQDATGTEDLDSFQAFYQRFHTDTAFQLSRIPFPIKGVPDNAANRPDYDETFTWTRDNWVMNKPIDLEATQFNRTLQTISDELVIEQLTHASGSYRMVRRFARIDGLWMLIYYQGVNPN